MRRAVLVGPIVGLMLALVACSGNTDEPSTDPSASTEESSSASAVSVPDARDLEDVPGLQTLDARPNPDWVLVAAGSAWVANVDKGIARYDAHTGRSQGSVGPAGGLGMDICTAMTTGFGSIWAVDCPTRTLFRFDLRSGKRLAAIELPVAGIQEEGSITAGAGGVYVVASGGNEITRVDAATNRVDEQTLPSQGAAGVRYGFGSLWVTSPSSENVTRIDPTDGHVEATVKVGAGAYFQDVGEGAAWVMNNTTGIVWRIDPATNEATGIAVSTTSIDGGDLTVGGGSVWARVTSALVARIDPTTGQLVERIGKPLGSGSADADREAVWISAHDSFVVYRVPID